jgi:hypothetical protein
VQSADVIAKYKWKLPDRPLKCEMNLQHLEDLRNMLANQPNRAGLLIIVARLGNGEKQRDLNRRRLGNVHDGLTMNLGINDRQIVVAEGERVRGYGRVEFYLAGDLVGALPVRRNSHVIKCDL